MTGHIHIYTGEGKGKTTAAFGLALRALGRGLRVCILQFLKGGETGERTAVKGLPGVYILCNSSERGFYKDLSVIERAEIYLEHTQNLREALALVKAGRIDLLILDEALDVYNLGAVDCRLLDELIENKPQALELVLTGRDAPPHYTRAASYISHIQNIKHPFDEGIPARRGIEF